MICDVTISGKFLLVADESNGNPSSAHGARRNSFVGTAQYVSPEVLSSKRAYFRLTACSLPLLISLK